MDNSKWMSCLLQFLASIEANGVDPTGYSRFVTYTEKAFLPTDNNLAKATSYLVGGISAVTIASVILLLLVILTILVISLVSAGIILPSTGIYSIIVLSTCMAIYFAAGYIFSKRVATETSLVIQQSVRSSAILGINSVVRDIIYLGLCE